MNKSDQYPEFVNYFSKEHPWAKRLTRRLERKRGKRLIQAGEYDLATSRQVKRTQGWLTH